jgi:hypothetical protein
MSTDTMPRPIALYRPWLPRALAALSERWAQWHARRRDRQAARAIDELSSRMLADIGASDQLIGQRRWRELSEQATRMRSLYFHG